MPKCDDCGRINKLEQKPACADYQHLGNVCCFKYTCYNNCIYWCPNGHLNKCNEEAGWFYPQNCNICGIKWTPVFKWWGRSLPAYFEIFGYD